MVSHTQHVSILKTADVAKEDDIVTQCCKNSLFVQNAGEPCAQSVSITQNPLQLCRKPFNFY